MKKLRKALLFSVLVLVWMLTSCNTYHLNVKGIAYQSIRVKQSETQAKNRQEAKIVVLCDVDLLGNIGVTIENHTDNIMVVDKTKSFFRGSDGNSTCYYDPTINVLAQSTTIGHTSGGSINLGALGHAVGIGGVAGAVLSGITVGGANENASTTTNTTYTMDQPKISIAPHGKVFMGRVFQESIFGIDQLVNYAQFQSNDIINTTADNIPFNRSCAITISYSIDDEKTFDKIETVLYENSLIASHIKQTGHVNDALRAIYLAKNDLFEENHYTLCFGGDPWIREYIYGLVAITRERKKENYNAIKYNHNSFISYK